MTTRTLEDIGTWWIDHFDDPREELLYVQWARGRVHGFGRSNQDGRLYFMKKNDPHRPVFLAEVV